MSGKKKKKAGSWVPSIIAGRVLIREVASGQQAPGRGPGGKARLGQLLNPEIACQDQPQVPKFSL